MVKRRPGRPVKKWPKYSEAEIRHMIKKINDSMYRLEKAGLQNESAEYRKMMKYATSNPNGTGIMYNLNMETGTLRVSKDLSRYHTKKERAKFVEVLENILKAETRTVSGTRRALDRGYQTAKRRYKYKGSKEQYINVWHTARDIISKNKMEKLGSNTVMRMIEETNIYQLSQAELEEALKVLSRARTGNSGFNSAIRQVKDLKRTKTKKPKRRKTGARKKTKTVKPKKLT